MGKIFPNSSPDQNKWIRIAAILIFAAFIYDRYGDDIKKEASSVENAAEKAEKTEKKTNGWIEAQIVKYAGTETGREVIEALTRGRLREKTGAEDPALAFVQAANAEARYYDIKVGEGDVILNCGDEASFNWRLIDKDNREIMDTRRQGDPKRIKVGDGSFIPGVERSLYAMRRGGERRIHVPSALAYEDTGFFNSFVIAEDPVVVEVAAEEIFPIDDPAYVPVTLSVLNEAKGEFLQCGMAAAVELTLSGRDGEAVALDFIYGRENDAFPIWAQRMAEGLHVEESRSVALPDDARVRAMLEGALKENVSDAFFTDGETTLEIKLIALHSALAYSDVTPEASVIFDPE